MTTVHTSECSAAAQLTEVGRKDTVLLFGVGRAFWNESEKQGQARVPCKACVPGSTAELSQNWYLKVGSLKTEKDGSLVTDFTTRKSSLFEYPGL